MSNDAYIDDSYLQAQQQQEQQEWESSADNPLNYQQTQLNLKEIIMNSTTDLNSLSFENLVPTNSKYLTKNDVGDDGLILTIKGFKKEILEGDNGDEEKVILYFVEDVNPMVLNRTNSQLVGIATGAANAGEARGKQIVVYNDPSISFGGKVTGGIRIRKMQGAPRQAPVADPMEFESDVPF
jgi:hypothetical protein